MAPDKQSLTPPTDDGSMIEEPTHLVARIEEELELLARNVEILEKLTKSPPTGIIRLSEAMNLPIHKTRYSLHLLEREGVVQPSADGAVVTDRAREFWTVMNRSLDRMEGLIRQLKLRAAEHAERPSPGRKGY
jgi:predicted transcriptional regulator